jgi:hypothetical protein
MEIIIKGDIDVANKNGKNILNLNKFSSKSPIINIRGNFSINDTDDNTNFEVRTFLSQRYDISIDNIYVKKTK